MFTSPAILIFTSPATSLKIEWLALMLFAPAKNPGRGGEICWAGIPTSNWFRVCTGYVVTAAGRKLPWLAVGPGVVGIDWGAVVTLLPDSITWG